MPPVFFNIPSVARDPYSQKKLFEGHTRSPTYGRSVQICFISVICVEVLSFSAFSAVNAFAVSFAPLASFALLSPKFLFSCEEFHAAFILSYSSFANLEELKQCHIKYT
ncbi:MAG: hypothetical protein DMG65_24290 [Candidatus Angelobacter sp. Gp1-AA117]|nr:MAG: hypothetical protein DMG65_24290 [Candidatus Angelobacter sp. Gp1-AA117]